jgi:hypothetical protein
MFDPSSRYASIPVETMKVNGTTIPYIQRRFLPQGDSLQQLQQVTTVAGDRIDNISYKALGDPTQFWWICDANDAMYPPDLPFYPGTVLIVPVPSG